MWRTLTSELTALKMLKITSIIISLFQMSSHPAVCVHSTHGSACHTAVILRSADSSDHCRRGRVRLQRLLVLGGNLEHLDLLGVVVGGAGLPLEQVVVLDDIVMRPGGEGGQGEGAGA